MLRRVELFQQTLQGDRQQEQGIVEYGPLRLDATAYQAILEDSALELSHAEFDLLYLFLRNPGRAFGRAYLYETIWGEPSLGSDRTVDNTILRLRKKLATLGDSIETVRGVGYRLRRPED
jgi:DNA-binding response OmpR family regulator